MSRFQYLGLLLGCVVATLPLEFVYGFRVWRNPRRLAKAVLPGLMLFVVWDIFAIERGHWTYNENYLSGVSAGPLPIEELLFFIVIPAAAISGYEAVCASLRRRHA
jgi:lycopene cyclase domain-containing protein